MALRIATEDDHQPVLRIENEPTCHPRGRFGFSSERAPPPRLAVMEPRPGVTDGLSTRARLGDVSTADEDDLITERIVAKRTPENGRRGRWMADVGPRASRHVVGEGPAAREAHHAITFLVVRYLVEHDVEIRPQNALAQFQLRAIASGRFSSSPATAFATTLAADRTIP